MRADGNWDRLVGKSDDVRRVFDAAPMMIVAFEGPELRMVAANAAFRAFVPRFQGLGMRAEDFVPELQGQDFLEHFKRVYETGEPVRAVEWRLHVDVVGTGDIQERFFDLLVTPRRRDDGSVEGVMCIVDEVTDRVRARVAAEAQAQEMSERYEQMRVSATVMQQALLTASLPVIPGADISAEYLVAAEDTAAGGDWYDAITVGNRVLLVVGDVVGHGVEAAAVMAQLRTAVRMQLSQGLTVTQALEAVDRFSVLVPGSRSATICVGALDVDTGQFEYCTAGHPPPLLVTSAAHPRFLEPSGAGPLGRGAGFPTRTEFLSVGDAVLLYTDGLIERPGRPLAASTTEFADLAASIVAGGGFPIGDARPIERLCTQTLELLLRTTGYSDDVTLLAAQRTTRPSPLHLTLAATPEAAGVVRAELRRWLTDLGADSGDVMSVVHAVSEYVENAAEHAYQGQQSGSIMVEAALTNDGTMQASVADRGRWKTPSTAASTRGRGLALANMLGTQSRIVGSDHGTTVQLSHRLSRPVHIVTDPQIAHVGAATTTSDATFGMFEQDGRIVVTGEVDSRSAPTLAGRITAKSKAGTLPVTVDLSAVTHLGSGGISVLAEACDRAQRQGTDFALLAPPGTTAHHVLSLVRLPTATRSDVDLLN